MAAAVEARVNGGDHNDQLAKSIIDVWNDYLAVHRRLRSDPKLFIPYCEERLQYMKGDFYCYQSSKPDGKTKVNVQTKEGVQAINQTITYLQEKESISKPALQHPYSSADLLLDLDLCILAQEHAEDLGENGLTSHTGSSGHTPMQRAAIRGIKGSVYENLSFGNYETPTECILNLLIDDGVKSRIHRELLFKPQISKLGIGFARHSVYKF